MRLDVSYLHFISKEELRTLLSVELGMRNHEYVPIQVITRIGHLRSGECFKVVRKLLKNKLIVHVGGKCDGYKLTYLGYDYLALHTFLKRGLIKDVVCKIGVGKESDIYRCEQPDGTPIVLKLTRLGRRSFRTIKNNREYIQNRTSFNWLYLSRLSSIREFTFMQVLHQSGFPTPTPIDTNRHAILMSLIDGDPLCHIKKIGEHCSVKRIFHEALKLVVKFAEHGLIHGDFNEFNILISDSGQLTVIDFPQCISANHQNAQEYFDRDVECLYRFFDRMVVKINKQAKQESEQDAIHPNDVGFSVQQVPMPIFQEIQMKKRLDYEVNLLKHIKLSEAKQLELYQQDAKEVNEEQIQLSSEEEERQQQESQKQQELHEVGEDKQEKEVNEVEQIETGEKQQNMYDTELKKLIQELQQMPEEKALEKQPEEEENEQQQSDDEEFQMKEQWKGLTAYQIRQKLKEERRIQRQKKKQQMSTEEYIKKALNKQKNSRQSKPLNKGNHGAKKKNKQKTEAIKDGLQLNY